MPSLTQPGIAVTDTNTGTYIYTVTNTGMFTCYWQVHMILIGTPVTGRYSCYLRIHLLLAVTPATGRYTCY